LENQKEVQMLSLYSAFLAVAMAGLLMTVSAWAADVPGIGVKYGARDPAACSDGQLTAPMTPALARLIFICDAEGRARDQGQTLSSMILVGSVAISGFEAVRYEDDPVGADDIDRKAPVYELTGSYDLYTCSPVAPYSIGVPGHNCSRKRESNVSGYCFWRTEGAWECALPADVGFEGAEENVGPPAAN
jgi:hypothetical protein